MFFARTRRSAGEGEQKQIKLALVCIFPNNNNNNNNKKLMRRFFSLFTKRRTKNPTTTGAR
jgi:hypothetical protein